MVAILPPTLVSGIIEPLHTLCADGATPCRFLGYKFENGNTTYYVHQDGLLEVIRNRDEVLVRERGSWRKE